MSTSTILPEWLDTARVRAIAMDMDRTILPDSLELTPALRAAVGAAQGAGITPILATGRMFASARPYAQPARHHRPGDLLSGRARGRSGVG